MALWDSLSAKWDDLVVKWDDVGGAPTSSGKPIVKFKGSGGNWIFKRKELEEEKKKLIIKRRILRRRIKKKQPIREVDIPAAVSANLQPNQMLMKIDALIEEIDSDLKRRKKRDEEDIVVLMSY